MKRLVLCSIVGFILVMPSLFGQTPAPIPEEARKHFVMGATLFKDAKTADDFSQVVSEFKLAADLAPQWPDARYNLGLAKEAVGDFLGAIADLKVYQQFKLSESEARKVQDKLYALEAKEQKKAVTDAANAQATAKAQADTETAPQRNFIKKIQGDWSTDGDSYSFSISPLENGSAKITFKEKTFDKARAVSDISITGYSLRFSADYTWNRGEMLTDYNLSLDSDGSLKGTSTTKFTQRGEEENRELRRQGRVGPYRNLGYPADVTFTRR
jgi:tetratricopeptide (TPR) repeat protein